MQGLSLITLTFVALSACVGSGGHFSIDHESLGSDGVTGKPEVQEGVGVSGIGGSNFSGSSQYTALTSLNTFGFHGVSEGKKYISSDPITELQINILKDVSKEDASRLDLQLTEVGNPE